jgi:hypothetical protein
MDSHQVHENASDARDFPMSDPLDEHYRTVISEIARGRVVFFLGAGVNLCDRPEGTAWQPGQHLLPSRAELTEYLAERLSCRVDDANDLLRVCQYVEVTNGTGPLYEELRRVFDVDCPPTILHKFLATLPRSLRERG